MWAIQSVNLSVISLGQNSRELIHILIYLYQTDVTG